MDIKELQENCNCAKCVHCFDEYGHYSWLLWIPLPPKDNKRYYCNKEHKYIMPNNIRPCFKQL